MKHLFSDNGETYTSEANDLVREVANALKPIVKRWADAGYSLRDVENIISSESSLVCIQELLGRQVAHAKAQRAARNKSNE